MAKGLETKTAILDAAETLFAAAGYDAVSMRGIAAEAKVRLALVSYHFGTKEALFEAVIARRAGALSARRGLALDALLADGPVTVEAVLDAFLGPYLSLMLEGGPGWHSYGRLIAQTAQTDRWCDLIARHFDPTAQRFIDALLIAQPGLPREAALRGFVYVVATMVSVFAPNRRLDRLSAGGHSAEDLPLAYRSMLPFLSAGFRSLAG